MQIPLRRGRLFTDADREGQTRVALVGASAARRLWPGRDPIGQRLLMPTFVRGDRTPVWRTVVGVVSDVRYRGLDDVRLDVYDAALQAAQGATDLVIRTSGDPVRMTALVQAEARRMDPQVVIDRISTMDAIVGKETAPWRFTVWVLGLFGTLAFVLAGLGLVRARLARRHRAPPRVRDPTGARRTASRRHPYGAGRRRVARRGRTIARLVRGRCRRARDPRDAVRRDRTGCGQLCRAVSRSCSWSWRSPRSFPPAAPQRSSRSCCSASDPRTFYHCVASRYAQAGRVVRIAHLQEAPNLSFFASATTAAFLRYGEQEIN